MCAQLGVAIGDFYLLSSNQHEKLNVLGVVGRIL
jgi:hypothetical protein